MSQFSLTAALRLQAPTNTKQVIQQMRKDLAAGISVPINVKNAGGAGRQIDNIRKKTKDANNEAKSLALTFRTLARFVQFSLAARFVSTFTTSVSKAVGESLQFQRELIKISQVTGQTVSQLKSLSDTVTRLATSLGTSSTELLGATRILAQAGIRGKDLELTLDALAKTTLAATFENIEKTSEGVVAIMSQFNSTGADVEKQLGAINAVAGQFAVESGDLIAAVRRFGGVFASAGGDLNELLALFTSVRATTRESAESIATGLRTIFTRIQRPSTIKFLEELGVQLTDTAGRFKGPFEAARALSEAFAGLPEGDLRFVKIAEELGGFRQIGKVIPLLQQFSTAERALRAAQGGEDSLSKDAITAQQALTVQIQKTREEFAKLIRSFTEDAAFQTAATTVLSLARAFIRLADSLRVLAPLVGVAGAIGGVRVAAKGLAFLRGATATARPRGFNSGGAVGGSGNQDTVPAMLTPGEFVIRKDSADKIGLSNLRYLNQFGRLRQFSRGGSVSDNVRQSFSRDGKFQIKSIKQAKETISDVVSSLGSLDGQISQELKDLAVKRIRVSDSLTGPNGSKLSGLDVKGVSRFHNIGLSIGRRGRNAHTNATDQTVRHELGHEIDRRLIGGGPDNLASKQSGTFQNELTALLRPSLAKRTNSPYRLDSSEIFADLFANTTDEIRDLIVSTTDVRQGMTKLHRIMEKAGTSVQGLADIKADDLPFVEKTRKRSRARSGATVVPFPPPRVGGPVLGSPPINVPPSGGSGGRTPPTPPVNPPNNNPPNNPPPGGSGGRGRRRGINISAGLLTGLAFGGQVISQFAESAKAAVDETDKWSQGLSNGQLAWNSAIESAQSLTATLLTVAATFQALGVSIKGSSLTQIFGNFAKSARVRTQVLGRDLSTGGSAAGRFVGRGLERVAPVLGRLTALAGPVGILAAGLGAASSAIKTFVDIQGQRNLLERDVARGTVSATEGIKKAGELALQDRLSGLAIGATNLLQFGNSKTAKDNRKFLQESLVDGFGFFGTDAGVLRQQDENKFRADILPEQLKKNQDQINDFTKEFEAGVVSFSDVASTLGSNVLLANQARISGRRTAQSLLGESSDSVGRTLVSSVGLGFIEGSDTRNKRLTREAEKAQEFGDTQSNQQFDAFLQSLNPFIESVSKSSITFDEFIEQLGLSGVVAEGEFKGEKKLRGDQRKQLQEIFDKQRSLYRQQLSFLASFNFGLSSITGASTALNAELGVLLSSQSSLSNSYANAATIIEASLSGAADSLSDGVLDNALGTFTDLTGGAGKGAVDAIKGIESLRSAIPGLLNTLKDPEGQINLSDSGIRDRFERSVLDIVPSNLRSRFEAQFEKLELDEKALVGVDQGDFSNLLNAIFGPVESSLKEQVLPVLQNFAKAQSDVNKLTQDRLSAERDYIQTQRQSIDIQSEALKVIQDFGGQEFTPDQQRQTSVRSFNVGAEFAGVSNLSTGTAEDIRRVGDELRTAIQSTSVVGGAGRDNRDRLSQANQDLIKFTRDRISQIREEIELSRRRNKLEQDSLNSLFSGDAQGFIQNQSAAGASAALRTGDESLVRLFGSGAIGRAFNDLQDQNLPTEQIAEITRTALSSFGLSNAGGIANSLTGEERALQQEGQRLGSVLGELANNLSDVELLNVQAAQVNLQIGQGRLNQARGFNRGGTVFTPRGTDTVPAMLTPGEFVVTRSAVNRGNNLQMLKAMNNGSASPSAVANNTGYYQSGGVVGGGMSGDTINQINAAFNGFRQTVDKLSNMQISIKLDSTNVNVNFNGGGFLQNLNAVVKNAVVDEIQKQLPKLRQQTSGAFSMDASVL